MVLIGDNNWIKINRSIWDCFLWSFEKPKYAMCWIDILLMANYKDKKILFEGKPEVIERGSFITSMVKLSQRWCMNRETVKKFLDTLKNDGMISYETSNKRTLIKVIKYEFFQGLCDTYPTAEPAPKPTTEPTAEPATYPTTDPAQHKNIKESKESKEYIYSASDNAPKEPEPPKEPKVSKNDIEKFFEKVWELYPNKKGKGQVSDAKKKKLYEIGYDELSRAIKRYKTDLAKEEWRKPQNGSTFFNSGYVDYLDANYVPAEGKAEQAENNKIAIDENINDLDGVV